MPWSMATIVRKLGVPVSSWVLTTSNFRPHRLRNCSAGRASGVSQTLASVTIVATSADKKALIGSSGF